MSGAARSAPDSDSACSHDASSLQAAQANGKATENPSSGYGKPSLRLGSSAARALGRRAAGLLVGACVRLAQGDSLSAKLDLQRALSLAHRELANQQLVVQARGPPRRNPAWTLPARRPTSSWSCRRVPRRAKTLPNPCWRPGAPRCAGSCSGRRARPAA